MAPDHEGLQQCQACKNRVAGLKPFGKQSLEQGTLFPNYITSCYIVRELYKLYKLHIFPQPNTRLYRKVKSFLPILLLVFSEAFV